MTADLTERHAGGAGACSSLPKVHVRPEADALQAEFRSKPGAAHIASANAVNGLMWTVERWHPRRALEIGTGIGTLTRTLTGTDSDLQVVATEDDPFCLEQLRVNLAGHLDQIDVVPCYEAVPSTTFDLIVVDGGQPEQFVRRLAPGGVIFVEGDRAAQRDVILTSDRQVVAVHLASIRRDFPGGPNWPGQVWEGGCWIFKFEPSLMDRVRLRAMHTWNGRAIYLRRDLAVRRRPRVVASERS